MDYKKEQQIRKWLKKQKHLPKFLRDFHDQKDVFKTIGGMQNPPYQELSWIDGHCYSIDKFLWWMAVHEYTLQKCRAKQPFKNMRETIKAKEDKETEVFKKVLEKDKK